MGVISRKLFPACVNMCVCCPALRSRSRQPVKRYKKLLAEIFPKSPGCSPNERKIAKLCEYAAKNPFRIPKIAQYLEERCYKELRLDHVQLVNVITDVYSKLICMCKDQMAYFAANLLSVSIELLDDSKRDKVQIIGCQTLTKFIYNQVDGTYTYNIENLVQKVCMLARKMEEEDEKTQLRAASLQCVSAMIWFMTEFSHMFAEFDEIVHVILGNFEPNRNNEQDDDRGEAHHNWVDEVVRCEGRGAITETDSSYMIVKPRAEKKDPSLLTREEAETPKVWAQICIQRMVELAKESTTMRRILDPMLIYFDTNRQWVPHGLGLTVLSEMAYFVESPENKQLILASVVHHLDHKNVSHDPELKSYVIQITTALARQVRSEVALKDIGYVSDLCRHLRKSLQATVESVGEHELSLNTLLQSSIEDCLLEIARGIADARPLFDVMSTTLENLSPSSIVARASTGSMIILAHMIVIASVSSNTQQVFPEGLLLQLLKLMLYPDVEIRLSGHQIFSVLLIPNSNHLRRDASNHTRRWSSDSASVFASVTSLLDKLRREKDGTGVGKSEVCIQDGCVENENTDAERKHVWGPKKSPNFQKLSSITAGEIASSNAEPSVMKFSEDQVTQLLSAFWIQANLPDNNLANIEALAYSFCLTIISLRLRNPNNNLVVRIFQLLLSLLKVALDHSNGMLCPAHQRSLFTLSTAMLMFAAKMYQIPDIVDLLKPMLKSDADNYLGISDDFQVYTKTQADTKEYCSDHDNQVANALLVKLQSKMSKSYERIVDILVQKLSGITEMEEEELHIQLFDTFIPDDAMFGPESMLHLDHSHRVAHSKESLSFETDFPTSLVEDDASSESSVSDLSRFITKSPTPSSMSHVISIRQLLESALEAAGQVAGASVSTSPLPFSAMAGQCEALGTDSRKKLSTWLSHANGAQSAEKDDAPNGENAIVMKILGEDEPVHAGMNGLRLPPASPFDNFLKAARYA